MKHKQGSAIILTMFILSGVLIIALSGAYLVMAGIKASGTQAQSMRAYFAAEAGIENILWKVRQDGFNHSSIPPIIVIAATPLVTDNLQYEVIFSDNPPRTYTAIGDYQTAKRSVEVSF